MRRISLALFLILLGCSDSRDVMDELPNSSIAGAPREDVPESRMEGMLARPVTIGEDGPRLDACGALGAVGRSTPNGVALRTAPFAEAREIEMLTDGTRLHICTRSFDQRWLGVVVIPAPAPPSEGSNASSAAPLDCGVTAPVDRKQPYAGPCRSGWVASAYVALIGS